MSQKMEQTDARDEILDRAATQIRESEPSPEVVAQAADRVWKALGGTSDSRHGMRLVDDEDSRDDLDALPGNVVDIASRRASRNRWWAAAAVLIAALGIGNLLVGELWHPGPSATVKTVDGQLFRVTDMAQIPIAVGDEIQEGDVIRTSREGAAVVRLDDGSLVELAARSEMSIDESRKGTTLELGHGNIIVEAAKQRDRHLMVATDDCLVSVVGTIFSVNHGTKGSKVSVIEGEVNVNHGGSKDVLLPGQQVTTHRLLARTKVADEISWSQNVDDYLKILQQYSELQDELHQALSNDLRYSSELLDLMPENTVFYAASPNLAEAVSKTHAVLQDRLDENPELAEWWAAEVADDFQEHVDEIVTIFSDFGSFLGDELATGGYLEDQELGGVVALAQVDDVAGLQAYIAGKLDELAAEHPNVHFDDTIFVDDPAAVQGQGNNLYIWFHDGGYAVATSNPEQLLRVATLLDQGGDNAFIGSEFYNSISELYAEGAEYLIAADLNSVLTLAAGEEDADVLNQRFADVGIDSVRHLMLAQKSQESMSHHRAVVTFDEPRDGLASWLAAPSAMGGLGFVSPDAKLVTGIVFKDPAAMLDDILAFTGGTGEHLEAMEDKYGISLREDFAASLGGEVVMALDGPLLPTPSWKTILEVYDPARIQWSFEQMLVAINQHLADEGSTEVLTLEETVIGGRTFYSLPVDKVTLHYTFVEGYLLMGASPALLDQAIRYRDAGQSITESGKFQALLPQDGRNNFSALVYQDLSSVMQAMAEKLANGMLSDEQQAQLDALKGNGGPMLGYAYGDDERITMAAGTRGNFLTSVLLRALGLKNPAGLEALLGDLVEI